jgi:hypothetical protein
MNYDIQFTDDDERRRVYGELPDAQIDVLAEALTKLADDPIANSDIPPCPPFRRIGRLLEVKLKFDGRIYFVRFFIHVDEPSKKIAVRRVTINPPLEKRSATIEPVGMDELRVKDEVEIPSPNPR